MEASDLKDMQMGVQPLDAILNQHELKHADLVEVSTEQLTHKMVAKGRKGRRLSLKIQMKIVHALNAALALRVPGRTYAARELFNYKGKE